MNPWACECAWASSVLLSLHLLLYHNRSISRQVYRLTGWHRALIVSKYQYPLRVMIGLGGADLISTLLLFLFSIRGVTGLGSPSKVCAEVGYCVQLEVYLALVGIFVTAYGVRLAYMAIVGCSLFHLALGLKRNGKDARMYPILPTTAIRHAPATEPGVSIKDSPVISRPLVFDKVCIQCHAAQCAPNSAFCGADCIRISKQNSPRIMELPPVHHMFREISDLFTARWSSPAMKPLPKRIFLITSTEDQDRTHKIYREGVEIKRNLMIHGIEPGNQQQLWYGTTRECGVGDPGHESLCSSTTCPMCNHIRCRFDIGHYGGRYGSHARGIRVSPASSKSHLYARNLIGSQWTALLLDSVVVGNPQPASVDESESSVPPSGFDSIVRSESESTTEQEFTLYHNDAIRPLYLVLYQIPATSST